MPTAKTYRTIEQKLADLEAQKARLLKTSRKLDNAQKVLVGAIVITQAQSDPKSAAKLADLLRTKPTRDIDHKRLAPLVERLDRIAKGQPEPAEAVQKPDTAVTP